MTGCVLWTGRLSPQGYGVECGELVHRRAYRNANGEIPDGYQVHHQCGVRACVNPGHLVALPPREHNGWHGTNLRSVIDSNRAKTHCPQGHAYDEENTVWKRGHRHCRECERQRSRDRYYRDLETSRESGRERSRLKRRADGVPERRSAVQRPAIMCGTCGAMFVPATSSSRYCSIACRPQSQKRPDEWKACQQCGHLFARNRKLTGRQWAAQRFCSRSCSMTSRNTRCPETRAGVGDAA